MKRTAFILLLILVCYQTPANQLLRLPILVEHYHRHNNDEGMSLLEFLREHYSKDHRDADQSEDEQLPFKNPGSTDVSYALLPPAVAMVQGSHRPSLKQSLKPSHIITRQQDAVFHPPK